MKAANATASLVLALIFALTAAIGIAAAVEAPPSLMSRADRLAGLRVIEQDARLALAHCRTLADAADRPVCRAQARVDERIAIATLEARYRGTVYAQEWVDEVQARANHSVGCARRLLQT
jgi:hypothetical protein